MQVRRIKPFNEPPVNRYQQLSCLVALALGLQEVGEVGGRAEFEEFRMVVTGTVEGLMKAGFGFHLIADRRRSHKLTFETIQLRLIEPFVTAIDEVQCLGNRGKANSVCSAFA